MSYFITININHHSPYGGIHKTIFILYKTFCMIKFFENTRDEGNLAMFEGFYLDFSGKFTLEMEVKENPKLSFQNFQGLGVKTNFAKILGSGCWHGLEFRKIATNPEQYLYG